MPSPNDGFPSMRRFTILFSTVRKLFYEQNGHSRSENLRFSSRGLNC